jgi:hypothetical protein
MTSHIYKVDLSKPAKRSTNIATLDKQIKYVKERICAAGRDKKGWSVESTRIDQRYNMTNFIETSLTNKCTLAIQCKPRIARAPASYEHDVTSIDVKHDR